MDKLPFLEDIYPKLFLYAITLRSPVAKGHLRMIQVPKLPDNYTLITARSIPGENRLLETNMPVLADSELSYIGEPVAILLGPDKINLELLAAQCTVIADEDPPVFTYNRTVQGTVTREKETGNTEKEFEKDLQIVTNTFNTGIQDHWYAEPSGAITFFSEEKKIGKLKMEDGKRRKKSHKNEQELSNNDNKQEAASSLISNSSFLIVKTATQWPNHVKQSVARVLNIAPSYVAVEQTALSLHMDGKLWYPSLIACHAGLGTFLTHQPVRMILNREEDFYYSPKRAACSITLSSAINNNGKITATKTDISVNLGAYQVNENELIDQITLGAAGCCQYDNLKIAAKANCTNLPPQGAFTGFGLSQGLYAAERHISIISDLMKIDPAIWRKESLAKDSRINQLIDMVIKQSDYSRKWAAYELLRQTQESQVNDINENPRGIGISCGFQTSGLIHDPSFKPPFTPPAAEVTLTIENKLEIRTSIASSEDYSRIWEKAASESISVEPGNVRIIINDDTGKVIPDCGPSCSSRNITIVTKLVEKCCQQIKKQKNAGTPLPITVKRSAKPVSYDPKNNGNACAVVEVCIDLVECTPNVRGVWLLVDAGRIISRNRAKRALIRGAVQALGWAYTENIEYINGQLTKQQFDNFSIPSPVEIPPIHIDFINSKNTESKGIGELPFTCIPSAFIQAVSQAMDHPFLNLPLKRSEIWEMAGSRGTHVN